jgi:trimeric autotransporter adhesin
MRQLGIIVCLLATLVLWGCGGKKKTPAAAPAKVTVDLAGLSLNFGDIFTLSSSQVHVVDASGNVLSNGPTFTVSSSNTSLVTINSANNSEICAGVFNSNATVCNGNSLTAGTANITVSAQGVSSDPIPVSVHPRVTSAAVVVNVPLPAPVCTSQNGTLPYKLIACNAGTVSNGCSGGSDIHDSLGTITWSTSDSAIASVASDGTVTSKLPGAVNVTATVGAVNQVNPTPALFVACAPKTISIHVTGVADTAFALDPTASIPVNSVKLDADVTDTLGQPIAGAPLTWSSFTPASATVGSDGTVTAVAAGKTSVVASCTPPTCNKAPALSPSPIPAGTGSPVFGNLVTGSVAGTSTPTVYATAPTQTDGTTANMTLLVIDPANAGSPTTVTLPHAANSMVFDPAGAKAYLGTADGHGLMIFDPNNPTGTITPVGDGTITGSVIRVSRDGTRVVISDTSAGKVFVYNTSATTNNIETFALSNVSGADFAGDNSKGLFSSSTAANSLFYVPGGGSRAISPTGNDVKFLPQGSVAYFGGSSITGISSCSTSTQIVNVETKPNPVNVWGVATDGSHIVGANTTGWVDLAPPVPPGPCPSPFTSTLRTANYPTASFVDTPLQVVATPDSKKVFMTGFKPASAATTNGVPFYDLTAGTAGNVGGIPVGAQVFSGGLTLDGTALYLGVGGSTPGVYKVDLTQATPAASRLVDTTSSTFVPSIVTVRPK